ncbi:hypothetical protein ACFPRL_11270 [Pseudoclavibacter helvolus]
MLVDDGAHVTLEIAAEVGDQALLLGGEVCLEPREVAWQQLKLVVVHDRPVPIRAGDGRSVIVRPATLPLATMRALREPTNSRPGCASGLAESVNSGPHSGQAVVSALQFRQPLPQSHRDSVAFA